MTKEPGCHVASIPRGVYGRISKIEEKPDLDDVLDAEVHVRLDGMIQRGKALLERVRAIRAKLDLPKMTPPENEDL